MAQGIGEALRGNINAFADNATGTDDTKSRNVAERGEQEFASGKYAGTGAGVTPHDTERERVNRGLQGENTAFAHGHGQGTSTANSANSSAASATTASSTSASTAPPLPERNI